MMKNNIFISIIIPHYKNEDILKNCLNTLMNQNYRHFEVIVILNGISYDINSKLHGRSNKIKYLMNKENVGFSKAINQGIKISQGQLIFILNDDTTLPNNTIQKIADMCNKNTNYGSYAIKIMNMTNKEKIDSAGLMFSTYGYGNRSNREIMQNEVRPVEVFGPCGAGAIYRKDALDKIGLFNKDYFFFYEDLEIAFRLQLAGFKCLYLPSIDIYHFGSHTLNNFLKRKVVEALKNSILTLVRCLPMPLFKEYHRRILKFYLFAIRSLIIEGFKTEVFKSLLLILLKLPKYLIIRIFTYRVKKENIQYIKTLLYKGPVEINYPNGKIVL